MYARRMRSKFHTTNWSVAVLWAPGTHGCLSRMLFEVSFFSINESKFKFFYRDYNSNFRPDRVCPTVTVRQTATDCDSAGSFQGRCANVCQQPLSKTTTVLHPRSYPVVRPAGLVWHSIPISNTEEALAATAIIWNT